MKIIGIFSNARKDIDHLGAKRVYEVLKNKCKVICAQDLGIEGIVTVSKDEFINQAECIIVLGGDGTILNVARMFFRHNIPILGINMGNLGFLAEIDKTNLEQSVEKFLRGEYKKEKRNMIFASVERDGQIIGKCNALNEITVSCAKYKRMIELDIFIDDIKVDSYWADGVICATPTGSTAYSLSAGGPVVDPSLGVCIVTPICPHTLSSRSIVMPMDKELKIMIKGKPKRTSVLTMDGQDGYELQYGDIVRICESYHKVTFIKLNEKGFYTVLKKKMGERSKLHD
ncbi:MAG: NAD(+)/NADH kinase [Ruminococcaceae bacterium]|nr:NAD(+)/NADH kinase [Oscillospiraceae bacterium]